MKVVEFEPRKPRRPSAAEMAWKAAETQRESVRLGQLATIQWEEAAERFERDRERFGDPEPTEWPWIAVKSWPYPNPSKSAINHLVNRRERNGMQAIEGKEVVKYMSPDGKEGGTRGVAYIHMGRFRQWFDEYGRA